MNPFHTLTDEQLGEWHMLTTRCERLNALLLAEQNKVAFLNAELANAHAKYAAADEDWRADFDRLCAERTFYADKLQSTAALLRELAELVVPAVRAFVEAWSHLTDSALTPEALSERHHARRVMSIIETVLP